MVNMSNQRKDSGFAAGVAVVILAAIGCGADSSTPPSATPDESAKEDDLRGRFSVLGTERPAPVPDDPELRRGFERWAILCAGCHGQSGKGDGAVAELLMIAPGDLTDPETLVFTTDSERATVIAEGIDGSPMIGWKELLSAEEIEAVSRYLRSLQASGSEGVRSP